MAGGESHLVCRDPEDVARRLRGFGKSQQPRIERLELTSAAGGVVLSVAGPDLREADDAPLDGRLHILFRLRDGRITHVHDYRSREEALAAAEAPPPPIPPRESAPGYVYSYRSLARGASAARTAGRSAQRRSPRAARINAWVARTAFPP